MTLKAPIQRKRQPDLLPLMDCIFLILFIFFYLMLFLAKYDAIDVDLPNAEQSEQMKEQHVSIGINAEGEFFLVKNKLNIRQLQDELTKKVEEDANVTVLLTSDKNTPFHAVIAVIDIINLLQVSNFAIEVKSD